MVALFTRVVEDTGDTNMPKETNLLTAEVNEFIKTPNVKVIDTSFNMSYDGEFFYLVMLVNYESSPR